MVKMAFSTENKQKSDFDFPKLWLDHNESARVCLLDSEPEVFWVHTLKSVTLINGQVQMETVKGKNGMYEQPKTDFIARALCMGNPNTLMEKDKDPENCPMCSAANESDYVEGAKRRYAIHVLHYKTKPGSFEVQAPFSADVEVWSFTNMVFDTLVSIGSEHGDLRAKDLLLGPCTNKGFQKFDIQIGGQCVWIQDDEKKRYVQETYANNKVEDLLPIIGRKITREKAEEHIDVILMKARQAFGGSGDVGSGAGAASETAASMPNLDDMLSGMGGGSPEPTPSTESTPAPTEDPWTGDSVPDPAPAAEEEKPQEKKDTLSFDGLLEGL